MGTVEDDQLDQPLVYEILPKINKEERNHVFQETLGLDERDSILEPPWL